METKDYYIIVKNDFTIEKVLNLDNILIPNLMYIIKCKYIGTTATKKHGYFISSLFDKNNNRIENNEFLWNGISCTIKDTQQWVVVKRPNHKGMELSGTIIDKIGQSIAFMFDNTLQDGTAFIDLFKYIGELNKYAAHDSVNEINQKNFEIIRLKEELQIFKNDKAIYTDI